jgi:hypothetical protein
VTTRAAFRGTASAAALLIDVPTIGTAEAQRRVLSHWQPDSSLRTLPDGRWLLTLPEPMSIRAELASGQPLVLSGGGLAAPGLTGTSDMVTVFAEGEVVRIPLADTSGVDTSSWVDLSRLSRHRLSPLDQPSEVAEVPTALAIPQPDLRAAAGIKPPSGRLAAFQRPANRRPGDLRWIWPRWLLGLIGLALVALFVVAITWAIAEAGDDFHPFGALLAASWIVAMARGIRIVGSELTGTAASSLPRGPSRLRRLWARMVMGSPAGVLLRGRQQRYLARLTRQFERRQFDAALRDAIGLDGESGSEWLSLRLPQRRTSVAPSLTAASGEGAVDLPGTALDHLRALYRQAAEELEKAGRIEETAFVYADLLHDVRAAVDLLERHGRRRLAAELAEGRSLEPALIVRLWWRTGERQRAVAVARARGAFAAGIARLKEVDQDAARELRLAWVEACRDAGDPVAAVEAAWPEPTLRPLVLRDIASGMAMGGPRAAYLFAHLVTERPTAESLRQALALLESDDREARSRFVSALVTLRSADPVDDRHLATAALRSVLRDGSAPAARRTITALRDRCDPLMRADLPRPKPPTAGDEPVRFTLADSPGALPVYDAAALRGGAVLVAHGEHGVRLLTMDGRVRARWDVPAHSLVVADHGGTALLISVSNSLQTIRRLDLANRRFRPWTSVPLWRLLPSYVGRVLWVVDDDGLAFLDTLSARPKVLWRELDSTHAVRTINRSPEALTALVSIPPNEWTPERRIELLCWELPSLAMRLRRPFGRDEDFTQQSAALPGRLVAIGDEGLTRYLHYQKVVEREKTELTPASNGEALGLMFGDGVMEIEVRDQLVATVDCSQTGRPGLRLHDGLVTVWTRDGRLAVVDSGRRELLGNFRTIL